ncbi:family A G protein-coupled receptor-like protein [Rhizoclosmatium globosum]|uniref:Family A G protein-coupled receptor-like protein n=1 Tax=Rhizoclosmatium globosum TaxID=329046 RepID=A0A1Y2BZD7_9FUNG|nr:family A G protein-coupled receptor-like protein [Rhizoclosmatium globosum]|eukprot:ORY40129.1 family A G protein-coupled receptor-like protein [Rhizoclosmatium globosum]
MITISLCAADLINSAINCVLNIMRLAGVDSNEGFLCPLDACLLIIGCGITLLYCLGLTLFRYLSLVKRTKISRGFAFWFIIGAALLTIATTLFPFLVKSDWATSILVMRPSGTYCILFWATTDWTAKWILIVMLIWIASPVVFIGWAYYCIYATFQSSVNALQDNFEESGKHSSNSHPATKSGQASSVSSATSASILKPKEKRSSKFIKAATGSTEEEQTRLLYQSVSIAGVFLVGWSPYVVLILYEMSTNTTVSAIIDFLCVYCVILNQLINPFLVLFFNRQISDNVRKLLYKVETAALTDI